MLDEATRSTALEYYARIGAALFPIPAGSKNPTGIVSSFKKDWSNDPAQWRQWYAEHQCNFGLVAFASSLIIIDIDTKGEHGRAEAWALWCELCKSWGVETFQPQVQSQSGGWHVLFAIPNGVDPNTLRQPDAIKGRINVRCIGYVVAAGSHFEGRPYSLFPDAAAPYPAPEGLVKHCTSRPERKAGPVKVGSLDVGDVAAFLQWMTERNQFESYDAWFKIGMALKIEFGDAGFELWEKTFDDEPGTPDLAVSKWDSFSSEPTAESITLLSFIKEANALGWRGSIRKSSASMFGDVAQIAAAAGASLASGMPVPSVGGAVPMMDGQAEFTRLATPLLQDFLDSTEDAPTNPTATDLPDLPPQMSGHGLYAIMRDSIRRVFALAENPKLKVTRIHNPLGVLSQLHPDIYESTVRRLEGMGHSIPRPKVKQIGQRLAENVARLTVTLEKWEYDPKTGNIENDNPDNIRFGLEYLGLEIRWNAWNEIMEIRGGSDTNLRFDRWSEVNDNVVATLMTRWAQTKTRFRPGLDFAWRTLMALSRENTQDPVLETLNTLASKWDKTPRLVTWLSKYCGAPCDVYHQAVGLLIIGGIVKRAREPGCKFDFMPVFYGPQGTGKSTLARLLALRLDWFDDTIQLGDASKELVLSLAGRLVVEIGEMGMRSNTNASQVKAMISRQVDAGRTAYARTVSRRGRRNIFIGTTNDEQPLSDPTGNRRFLPIRVNGAIDLIALAQDVDQLLGEAATLHAEGATFELAKEVWGVAAEYQDSARSLSDLEHYLHDWFGETDYNKQSFVTVSDLLRLCDATGRKNVNSLVHSTMPKLGFKEASVRVDGKRSRVWYRDPNLPATVQNLAGHVTSLPRFVPDLSTSTPRAVIRAALPAPSTSLPAIPNR